MSRLFIRWIYFYTELNADRDKKHLFTGYFPVTTNRLSKFILHSRQIHLQFKILYSHSLIMTLVVEGSKPFRLISPLFNSPYSIDTFLLSYCNQILMSKKYV